MDVLEHIKDDARFLKSCTRHVKKGGLVVINVPALNSFFSSYDSAVGHQRRYSKKQLNTVLSKAGVNIHFINWWGLSLLPFLLVRKFTSYFSTPASVVACGIRPPNELTNHLLNLLRKVETKVIKHPPLGSSLIAVGSVLS